MDEAWDDVLEKRRNIGQLALDAGLAATPQDPPDGALAAFRFVDTHDPEERLEEAALWKAMHDEYGDAIVPIGREQDPCGLPVFGRMLRFRGHLEANPVSPHLPYWDDPAFLHHCHREFSVMPIDRVEEAVADLHSRRLDAFVKSTQSKHAIFRIPVGTRPNEVIGDMAYSFIDGGPELMVQQSVRMEYEHRFFVIDREIVTSSPVQPSLTPLDHPLPAATMYATPGSKRPVRNAQVLEALMAVAQTVAGSMQEPHAVVDCAMIDGRAGVIEFNPLQLGRVGLFACDVRALAAASRKLLREPEPEPTPSPMP